MPFASESFLYFIIMLVAVVGPFFFIPMRGMSIAVGKGFFIMILVVIGLLAYGINVLRRGEITIPKSPIWVALAAIVGLGLLGSILSPAFSMSFFGYGFETTSWVFLIIFSFMALASYGVIRTYERVMMVFGGLLIPFVVLFILHIIRFIAGPATANLWVMGSNTASIIGTSGDLGIFLGLIVIVATFTLELANLARPAKWIIAIMGILAAIMLAFMNIHIVWIVIGLVMLISALYLFSFAYWDPTSNLYKKINRVPAYVLTVFMISILAIFFGGFLNNVASHHQSIVYNDVRPSVGLTVRALGASIKHNPATGYGPNMFNALWNASKPPALSGNTISENGFSLGSGYIPTQLAENGILGMIAWIAFFVFLIIALFRALTQGFNGSLDRYVTILLSVSILYLGILAWVYVPGAYLIVLMAVLIGAFFGIRSLHTNNDKTYSFIKDPRASFFGILGVTLLVVATIFGGYIVIRKFASFVDYARGEQALAKNNIAAGESDIALAAAFASHDVYHTALVNLAISQVNQLVGSASQSGNKDQLATQANQLLGAALGHAQAAISADPSNYQNYILEGDVYRVMVNLGIAGASDKSLAAYNQAQKLDPNDSIVRLSFAQLDIANNNASGALAEISKSINQYPTAAAYELRAQIQISQNDATDAIAAFKSALALDPYNATLAYEYGIILYNQSDYTDAVSAFQRAILSNNGLVQAYIYLGVSYEKSGDQTDADKVYALLRSKISNADALISQVRNGGATAPAATSTSTTTPSPAKSTPASKSKVAPAAKK